MWVYLIACDDADAVKIGYANDVANRCMLLQIGNPLQLRVAASAVSARAAADELLLQRRFEKHLIRGEWFRQEPVLAELLPVFEGGRLAEFTAAIESDLRAAAPHKQLRLPMTLARADWKARFSELRRQTQAKKRAAKEARKSWV